MTAKNRQDRLEQRACAVVLAIILFFLGTIIIRTFTRQILVKRMGMKNTFTNIVLFDVEDLSTAAEDEIKPSVEIDWEALYPFQNSVIGMETKAKKAGFIDRYKNRIQSAEDKIDTYVTDYLIGYKKIVELANKYEDIIHWTYASYAEYNGVIKLLDGQLTSYVEKCDVTADAANVISFAAYCHDNDIDFLYLQAPYKISKTQDRDISGVLDFSNQNADDLILQLRQANVDVFDFREVIDAEGLNHHDLFYRTDHHWRAETGLWASYHILEYLNQHYNYNVDPDLLNENNFTSVLYPKWFLGTYGKKVTLSIADPDDFSLIYPKFETAISFSIPDAQVDLVGDFSIVYDMDFAEEMDYYRRNPYGAYMYGEHALVRFGNHLSENDLRILVIHDSFGDCVLPFVSLGVGYVDSLDLRFFTGSVQSFIEESKPDAVMVLYNPGFIKANETYYKNLFDFS